MAKTKSTGKVYIYSTLACNQKYQNYEINAGISTPTDFILVAGGTGVADKRIETPLGVVTEVSADDYAKLKSNPDFELHVKNGFITVQEIEADPEKVAADMAMDDGSRPLVEGDSRMGLVDPDMTVTTN